MDPRMNELIEKLQRRTIDRRAFIAQASALGASALAIGNVLDVTAANASQDEEGGVFIDTIDGDPPTLNYAITAGATDGAVASKIQEGLVWTDRDYNIHPLLAKSWEITDDGLQYTFHLQEGVLFHDGTPMTSADVKYTMEEVVKQYQPTVGPVFQGISGIDTPDDLTVVVHFDEPSGPFLGSLTRTGCPILPKHLFEGTDPLTNPHSLSEPIGTGPFMFKEWSRGESITLERFPDYWQENKPSIDTIIMRQVPQPASRISSLQTGEVDYCYYYFFDVAEYENLKDDPNLQFRTGAGHTEANQIIINTRNTPFDDKVVRQALMIGIDRQFIVDAVFFGVADVAKSSISHTIPWAYNPDVDYTTTYAYDPDRANAMLDEAGYARDGDYRFSLRLVYDPARAGYNAFAQILKEQWNALGVDVEVVPLERQVMIQDVFMDWNFDATIQSYTTRGEPALGIARSYISSSIGQASFNNASGYSNPEVDELFVQGATHATEEQRAPFYFDAQEILQEDLPVLNIADSRGVDVGSVRFNLADSVWLGVSSNDGWEDLKMEQSE